jgi:Uma2 family endonuclease
MNALLSSNLSDANRYHAEGRLRPFTPSEFNKLFELAILSHDEHLEFHDGLILNSDSTPRPFTISEYQNLIAAGILNESEPLELLEGFVVTKMPRNTAHESVSDLLEGFLLTALPQAWYLRAQRSIVLSDSQPEPDFAVVRGPRGRYLNNHPTAEDIALLIEVADSSLASDRRDKGKLYAQASIPIYWIVNIPERAVEVYTQPDSLAGTPRYLQQSTYYDSESVPLVLDQLILGEIVVSDILPGLAAAE